MGELTKKTTKAWNIPKNTEDYQDFSEWRDE